MKVRNTFIIFVVSGFWHGANWTFIVWGALNAIYFLPLLLRDKNRVHTGDIAANRLLPSLKELKGMLITFGLTVIAWVFFRAENIGHAVQYLYDIFAGLGSYKNYYKTYSLLYNFNLVLIFIIILFIVVEWLGRKDEYAIEKLDYKLNKPIRWMVYSLLIFVIGMYMPSAESPFIYFQF